MALLESPSISNMSERNPKSGRGLPQQDRTLASRYECKYLIDSEAAQVLRGTIQKFMRPDRFAVDRPGYRYTISSLYFDSPTLDLFRGTCEGRLTRYKLRVRTYTDEPASKLFFEIKKRWNQVVLKTRVGVDRALATSILEHGNPVGDVPTSLAEFRMRMTELAAEPALKVRYDREAYEARTSEPVRVTFDHNIQYAVTRSPECSVDGGVWRDTPLDGVVVEIKFTNACPAWVTQIIDRLQMMRESIPKYVCSLEDALSKAHAGNSLTPLYALGHTTPTNTPRDDRRRAGGGGQ